MVIHFFQLPEVAPYTREREIFTLFVARVVQKVYDKTVFLGLSADI